MSGQAYRGPNRGPSGCGTDLIVGLVAMAILGIVLIAFGIRWEWW